MVRCAIWYHLYNLKNTKNTHEGLLFSESKRRMLYDYRINEELLYEIKKNLYIILQSPI